MYELQEEHTSFIKNIGLYCYKIMPFGLKNVRATYQRLVNMMFVVEIGKNMEVYIDDMLVKSVRPRITSSTLIRCLTSPKGTR